MTFSEQGTVLNGTIADETTVGLGSEKYGFIAFKSGTILDFYNDGAVKRGLWQKILNCGLLAGKIMP